MLRKFFLKSYDNPLNKLRLKLWYFVNFTINPKVTFLRKLNKHLPGWLLCVYSEDDDQVVYGLTPTWGPLMVGDEMFINDPIISLNNIVDARYGFNGGLAESDANKYIPRDFRQRKVIWNKAMSTLDQITKKKNNSRECPSCKDPSGYSSGLTSDGHICPKCFGLGQIYAFGPQKRIGKRLLDGSEITIIRHQVTTVFQPDGLHAIIELYRTYHTGIVRDLVQDYLVKYCGIIIKKTFPNAQIFKVEDSKPEKNNWNAFFYTANGECKNLHLYLQKGDQYFNLFSGKAETPSSTPSKAGPKDVPNQDRWDICVDLLENLSKLEK